jgi:hypothetical protein
MDKRKVIDAYQRGFLTPQECAQVLGLEKSQLQGLLEDLPMEMKRSITLDNHPASG